MIWDVVHLNHMGCASKHAKMHLSHEKNVRVGGLEGKGGEGDFERNYAMLRL